MLMPILIAIAAISVVLVIVVATRPGDFRITRTAAMPAPPVAVFAQVNDFHKWEAWSPWAKLDPGCKYSYAGPGAGTGALFSWSGNSKVGEGNMTILESRPDELIRIKLEFLKPFKATSTSEFTFKPEGNQTAVTWSMYGKNNFMAKAMGLVINCDKMVGGDFERGLVNLKSIVETAMKS
jgi:Polyketide cyclase / dehydrase and lipid transport